MKKVILAALPAALALASCSNDEVVGEVANPDQIQFAASAANPSRAAAVYCSNNLPAEFNLWATVGADTYINNDKVTVDAGGACTTTGTYYWPAVGTSINFYGVAGGSLDIEKKTVEFTTADDVASQTDLLYAYRTEQRKNGEVPPTVALNFRHALAQVVFKAKLAENSSIAVAVKGVKVNGVTAAGTYTLPAVNTVDQLAHPAGTGTVADNQRGYWSFGESKVSKAYGVTFTDAISVTEAGVDLTKSTEAAGETAADVAGAMLLIPDNNVTAWTAGAQTLSGSYFTVTATITTKVGEGEGAKTFTLWDGDIVVPVSISTWREGSKYTYTFVFGKGNGGYDPAKPDTPVLVPISLSCSVDEFVPVNDTPDVEMTTAETNAD